MILSGKTLLRQPQSKKNWAFEDILFKYLLNKMISATLILIKFKISPNQKRKEKKTRSIKFTRSIYL